MSELGVVTKRSQWRWTTNNNNI